jgi:hypothetical protein
MQRDFKGIWVPKEIWMLQNLNWPEKLMLIEINSLDNKHGCYAGNDYFAGFFQVSKGWVSKVINSLVKKGYVTSELVYKSGSKEVEKRILRISRWYDKPSRGMAQKEHTHATKLPGGMLEKEHTYETEQPEGMTPKDHVYATEPLECVVQKCDTYPTERPGGMVEKCDTPMVEKCQENNTEINKLSGNSASGVCHKGNLKKISKPEQEEIPQTAKSASRKNTKFNSDSDPYLLAKLLEHEIRSHSSQFPQSEGNRQRWAKDIDLMIRRDKLDPDAIAEVIMWAQNDSFWQSNILSGKKLRQKYLQLSMKISSKGRSNHEFCE